MSFLVQSLILGTLLSLVLTAPASAADLAPHKFHQRGERVQGADRERAIAMASALPRVKNALAIRPGPEHVDAVWAYDDLLVVLWKQNNGRTVVTVDINTDDWSTGWIVAGSTNVAPGSITYHFTWLMKWWVWLILSGAFLVAVWPATRPTLPALGDLAALSTLHASSCAYFLLAPHEWAYPLTPKVCYGMVVLALAWFGIRGVGWAIGRWSIPRFDSRAPFAVLVAIAVVLGVARFASAVDQPALNDVGPASLSGAALLNDYGRVYGNMEDTPVLNNGDTYGPVTYIAYAIPERISRLAEPVARHRYTPPIVAGLGELLALVLLVLAALRFGDRHSAARAAALWCAFGPTTIALVGGTNDWLVAVLVGAALVLISSPTRRGIALAAAGWAKFAPFLAIPALVVIGTRNVRVQAKRYVLGVGAVSLFFGVFAIWQPNGFHRFWKATLSSQADRDPVNTFWAMIGLEGIISFVGVACLLATVPMLLRWQRPSAAHAVGGVAGAVALVQLPLRAWWYAYLLWVLPPLILLLVRTKDDQTPASALPSSASSTGT